MPPLAGNGPGRRGAGGRLRNGAVRRCGENIAPGVRRQWGDNNRLKASLLAAERLKGRPREQAGGGQTGRPKDEVGASPAWRRALGFDIAES